MPRYVDAQERLVDIATATIKVARESGSQAVTIRAVADALDGSTKLVTNYLSTRAELLANALNLAVVRWEAELETELENVPERDQFHAMIHWLVSFQPEDQILHAFTMEIAANGNLETELTDSLRRESLKFREALRDVADAAGFESPDMTAEIVYLLVRGAYFSNLEDGVFWHSGHLEKVIFTVLDSQPRRP